MERRKEIICKYNEMCDSLGIIHLEHYGKNHSGSGHLYITRIPGISEETRNSIIAETENRGIACNVHYKPLPMMTAYKNIGYDIADFPNAHNFFKNEITLPLHTKLSDDDVKIVRTKRFGMKPMFPEDACIQMELLGHNFFVFRNAETDEVNVVYKRKGNTYGIIEPEC